MFSIIENFLYLGSLNDVCTPSLLIDLQITHLINLSWTRIILDSSYEILHLPLNDSLDENLINYFQETNQFIDKSLKHFHGKCFVFCKHGRSRSPAVIMAYLIYKKQYDLSSSYKYLLNICPTISPNRNYLEQLNQYSVEVKKKSIETKTY